MRLRARRRHANYELYSIVARDYVAQFVAVLSVVYITISRFEFVGKFAKGLYIRNILQDTRVYIILLAVRRIVETASVLHLCFFDIHPLF